MLKKNNKNNHRQSHRHNRTGKIGKNITQISLITFGVIFFILFGFSSEVRAADYYCDSCGSCQDIIDNNAGDGDVIYLTKDIIDNEDTCLEFNSKSGITFNCDDYVIDGVGYSNSYGIYFYNAGNNTVSNCYITGFYRGIYIQSSNSIIFNNVIANYNSYGIYFYYSGSNILNNIITANNNSYGIYFNNSSNLNTLSDITANNNSYGIYFSGGGTDNNIINITANNNTNSGIYFYGYWSTNFLGNTLSNALVENNSKGIYFSYYCKSNKISNITANYNQYGIYFFNYYSENNEIFNSIIKWNTLRDVYIYNTTHVGNAFYNNQFYSSSKIYDNGSGTLWDNGTTGNHWEVYDTEDEGCADPTPSDGLCDAPYWKDNYPKHINSITNHYCNSCTDCNQKIASSTDNITIYLTKNINNNIGHCIDLSNKQNVVFDCQGYTIDKDSVSIGNGIYLNNGGGDGFNTIQNCLISDFDTGINIVDSNYNTITSSTIKQNSVNIAITNSTSNTFYNNKFLSRNEISILDIVSIDNNWDNSTDTGNHWEGYDEEDEYCYDDGSSLGSTAGDWICDDGYEIITTSSSVIKPKDNYAKYVGELDDSICYSCDDCNAKITATSSGAVIKLANNIMNSSGTCIEFNNKTGITFDCQGYVIDGADSGYGIYIHGTGPDDDEFNVVTNCHITNFEYGVYIYNSSNNTLDNVISNYNKNSSSIRYGIFINSSNFNSLNNITVNNNGIYGLYLQSSSYNTATTITAEKNSTSGIYFSSSDFNNFSDITAVNNNYGIYFTNSSSSTLANITANYNNNGIYLTSSNNNTIKDSNESNNSGIKFNPTNINIVSGIDNKFYNNDFISKNKIIDNGTNTQWDDGTSAGNWWQPYDSGDEECFDLDSNLICDAPYIINETSGTQDSFPKWKKLNDDVYYCTDCSSCSNYIANAMYGDTVVLSSHILNSEGNCIYFDNYKEGIIFDGNDFYIDGSGSSNGIYLSGYNDGSVIKNCTVTDFDYGIYVNNSKYNTLSDITVNYNNSYGFYLKYSNSNNLNNIISLDNNQGVSLYDSDSNFIIKSEITNNNNYGLEISSNSINNTIASSTIKLNPIDIFLNINSNNNAFYNNDLVSEEKIVLNSTVNYWDNGEKGNHWEAFDSDKEGCYDENNDSYCDDGVIGGSTPVTYILDNNNIDNHPKYVGVTNIYTCSTCDECNGMIIQASYGDTVQLTNNITGIAGTCIEFNYKQGIIFDCQHNIIDGNDTSESHGVYIVSNSTNDNNKIINCIINDFYYGIYLDQSYLNTIATTTLSSNSHGVYQYRSSNNTLTNLNADYNGYGIYLYYYSSNNKLFDIKTFRNTYGIYLYYYSNDNTIASSTIRLNQTNIKVGNGSWYKPANNVFYNNKFASNKRISDEGDNTHWNKWDSTNGNQAPGNQWEAFDNDNEGCVNDGTEICVADYEINASFTDYYPKYSGIATTTYICSTCDECNKKIINAEYGDIVQLDQDIIDVTGVCINLTYKDNITFDCDNNSIIGTGRESSLDKGIYFNDSDYNTIKDCSISRLGYGIYDRNLSNNNTFKNIVVDSNYYVGLDNKYYGGGIYLYSNSLNNIFTNITASNNRDGIHIVSSGNNSLANITANSNTNGIYFRENNNNDLTNITVNNNNIGIYLDNSSSNTLTSNILTNATSTYNNIGIYIDGDSDENIISSSTIKYNITDININNFQADKNIFYNNELISKDKVVDKGTNTYWNNQESGINITPGNHWQLFDTPDDCYIDGEDVVCCSGTGSYCDNPYKINSSSIDNFPKTGSLLTKVYECDNCVNCTNEINSADIGDTVKLIKDILGYSGTCIDFGTESFGITFDCGGHIINGSNIGHGIYIHELASRNNTVKNCNISNFGNGVYISASTESNIIKDITVSNCDTNGIYLYNTNSNILTNVNASNNGLDASGIKFYYADLNILDNIITNNNKYGIYINQMSDNNILTNITANYNNSNGIRIEGEYSYRKVNNNTIASSTVKWNTTADILVDTYSCGTTFYNNDFISKDNIIDNGDGGVYNYCGDNITAWDKDEAGNHWEIFDEEGEGCYDADNDGFCDDGIGPTALTYTIDSNSIDNHPKHIDSIATHYCNSCTDCNEKIVSSADGSVIYLATDIIDYIGHCIDLSNKQNMVFDCQGHTIDGDGDSDGDGIYLDNSSSIGLNMIKNCIISDFNKGIYIFGSDNNTIASSTIKQNITYDMDIDSNSDNNIFYNNEFLNESRIADNSVNTSWDNGVTGNHWEEYDEEYENCYDNVPEVGDGICDSGYTLVSSSGAVDNYAKYVGTLGALLCDSCADCNTKIAVANAGDVIKLNNNIVNYSGECIKFDGKTGITFDCQGYTIDGDNATLDSKGIYLLNSDNNNAIKNCRITGFHYGIYFYSSDSNILENVEANSNKYDSTNDDGYGIYFINSSFNSLTHITANYNYQYGIYFGSSDNNIIASSTINYNSNNIDGYGIYLDNSNTSTTTNSEIKWNSINIKITNTSNDNVFYNNEFISREKIVDEGINTKWDNGIDKGNWWEAYDTVEVEGCNDLDNNGICDSSYEVETGVFDYYPIYKFSNIKIYSCDSCSSCNKLIENALYGDIIKLSQDIYANTSCLSFKKYKEGITLDCDNIYSIVGKNTDNSKGIYIYGSSESPGNENNIIKNCAVSKFYRGIYINQSNGNTIDNVEVYNNNIIGIYLISNNNNLIDVIVNNNTVNTVGVGNYGIYINGSDNILTNITANDNDDYGIFISNGADNILTNITANNQDDFLVTSAGIILSSLNSGTLTDIIINNNGTGLKLSGSDDIMIINSEIKKNNIDISIDSTSDNNIFYNNSFTTKDKMKDEGIGTSWYYNTSGNWWEAYDTAAEGCYDSGESPDPDDIIPSYPNADDGICDNHYEVNSGIFDEYPKYKGIAATVYNCSSCSECNTFIEQAEYGDKIQLTQNIITNGDCINFNRKAGVIFDCQDYTITNSSGIYSGNGIYINGFGIESNRVINCNLLKFTNGIYIKNSDSNHIKNVTANYNSYGVYLYDSGYNNIIDTNIDYNQYGVYFNANNFTLPEEEGSVYNYLENISVQYSNNISSCNYIDWGYGLYFKYKSNYNTVASSTIKYHYYDIYLYDQYNEGNKFYNNKLTSKVRIRDYGTNTWWDNGTKGNYWEVFDNDAEGCYDADNNGLCDNGESIPTALTYKIDDGTVTDDGSASVDNHPGYVSSSGYATYNCSDCEDCNSWISIAQYGDTVRLTQDIFNHETTCIVFLYKQGVIFDGGDNIIDGTGSGSGIKMCGYGIEGNKIENIYNITGFDYGIYIEDSDENIFRDITANNNDNNGIHFQNSELNTLDSVTVNYNGDYGIYVKGDSIDINNDNYFTNITANYNDRGVCLYDYVQNSILNDIIANNNINDGIHFYSRASGNTLNNITVNNNNKAIYFNYYNQNNVLNNITSNNNTEGIYFYYSNGNNVIEASYTNSITGVYFKNSSNNKVASSTITNNNTGIDFYYADDNIIASNTVIDNVTDILINSGSDRNIFYFNKFNSNSAISDSGGNTHWNNWNGSNITPGNRWLTYDTAAEGCYDDGLHGGSDPAAYNGYCDDHYEVETGVYDEYPIRYSIMPLDFNITLAQTGLDALTGSSTCENVIIWEVNTIDTSVEPNEVHPVDFYSIYRSMDGGNSYSELTLVESGNYYIDNDVTNTVNYSYGVLARNGVYSKWANCDSGTYDHCEYANGTTTVQLYPTICSVDLNATSTDGCGFVGLNWNDVTPTDNYYAFRSLDQGVSYQDACSGEGDPSFSDNCTTTLSILDKDANPHPNDTVYYYQDTDATTSIYFYYKVRNCTGVCPSATECQPDEIGPRDDCYVESNIKMINPCYVFPMPTWKEVKP